MGLAAGVSWQVYPRSLSKIPVLPAPIQPCRALSAQPLCRVGRCWDGQKEVSPGMPEPLKVSSLEGTGSTSVLPPWERMKEPSRVPVSVPRGGSARGRLTEQRNDALPTPIPRPSFPLRGWAGLEGPEPPSPLPQPSALGRAGAPGLLRLRAGLGPGSTWRREERRAERGHAALTRVRGLRSREWGCVCVCIHVHVCAGLHRRGAPGHGAVSTEDGRERGHAGHGERGHAGHAGHGERGHTGGHTGHGEGAGPDAERGAMLRAQQLPRTPVSREPAGATCFTGE